MIINTINDTFNIICHMLIQIAIPIPWAGAGPTPLPMCGGRGVAGTTEESGAVGAAEGLEGQTSEGLVHGEGHDPRAPDHGMGIGNCRKARGNRPIFTTRFPNKQNTTKIQIAKKQCSATRSRSESNPA